MNDNALTIRRARISNFLSENKTVGFDDIKKISNGTGIEYETVRNDVKWLKKKDDDEYKYYNLEGLRKKSLDKVKDFDKMIQKTNDIIKDNEDDEIVLKAIHLKSQLLSDQHQLEHNGVGLLTEEINKE